jgi:hypothetical protein
LTHGQHDMRHAIDPDRGLSCGHDHSPEDRGAYYHAIARERRRPI